LQILVNIESSQERSLRGALGRGLFGLCENPSLVASLAFPTFSVFKVVYHEHPFTFCPSAMSVMP